MKRALINSLEPGRICDIVDVGNEFEVAATLSWIDCPDDATTMDIHDTESGEIVKFDILKTPGIENAYKVARTIGYKPIGDQLDMLFKELQATGTISADGPWASHVASIKAAIPKDDPAAVLEWNMQQAQNNP
jgi:hypothetical protein